MGTAKSARYKNVVPLPHWVYTFYQVPSADRADVELKCFPRIHGGQFKVAGEFAEWLIP